MSSETYTETSDVEIGTLETNEFYKTTEYYDMMNHIRNMRVLSDTQVGYYHQLSKKQLINILELYNMILVNVNYLFS